MRGVAGAGAGSDPSTGIEPKGSDEMKLVRLGVIAAAVAGGVQLVRRRVPRVDAVVRDGLDRGKDLAGQLPEHGRNVVAALPIPGSGSRNGDGRSGASARGEGASSKPGPKGRGESGIDFDSPPRTDDIGYREGAGTEGASDPTTEDDVASDAELVARERDALTVEGDNGHRLRDQTAGVEAQDIAAEQVSRRLNGVPTGDELDALEEEQSPTSTRGGGGA